MKPKTYNYTVVVVFSVKEKKSLAEIGKRLAVAKPKTKRKN